MLTRFRDYDDTLRTLELFQEQLGDFFEGITPAGTQWPAMHLTEEATGWTLHAELPGLGENDVEIVVEGDVVMVRGERKSDAPALEGYKAHLRERTRSSFARRFALGARVDADAVSATMKNGVLTVTLPKTKDLLPRQITVKAS